MFFIKDNHAYFGDDKLQRLPILEDDVRWALLFYQEEDDEYGLFYPKLFNIHECYDVKEYKECFLYRGNNLIKTLEQNTYRNVSCPLFTTEGLLFNPSHGILTLLNLKENTTKIRDFEDLFISKIHQVTETLFTLHGWVWQPFEYSEMFSLKHFEDIKANYHVDSYDLCREIPDECEHCRDALNDINQRRFNVELSSNFIAEVSPDYFLALQPEIIQLEKDKEKCEFLSEINKDLGFVKQLFQKEQYPFIIYKGTFDDDCYDDKVFVSCRGGDSGRDYDDIFEKITRYNGDKGKLWNFLASLPVWNYIPSFSCVKRCYHRYDDSIIKIHYIISFEDGCKMTIENEIHITHFGDDDQPNEKASPFVITFC